MAITRIQSASGLNTTFASSVAATFGSVNTYGNIILLAVEFDAGTVNSGNTPTDTAGNKYQRLGSIRTAAVFELEVWAAFNIKAQASNVVTITDTNAGVDSIVIVEEWSGVSTAFNLDATANAIGNSTAPSSGPLTTGDSNDLIWSAAALANGTSSLVLGSGFTNLTQNNTTFSNLGVESQITTSIGTFTGNFTGTTGSWNCITIALKAANIGFTPHISVGNGMSRSEVAN